MFLTFTAKIWFYPTPVDFRKQLDGLMHLLAGKLDMNPTSGELFVFRNRGGDKLKMLYWDGHGFWLLYKRIERGKFKLPKVCDDAMHINYDQFQWLLSGLDFTRHETRKALNIKRIY